jgi:trehalose synthase
VSYSRGAGIDVRWTVIAGNADFFRVTKRLHNFLHGNSGDGGMLADAESRIYRSVTARNAEELAAALRPHDVVILHDPQTAGLTARLKDAGAIVVWRSHVGAAQPNELVQQAWSFLEPYLENADACIFSRRAYVPPWAQAVRTEVIAPSIDAFSPKNQSMDSSTVLAILFHVGLLQGDPPNDVLPLFDRHDGSPGRVDHVCEILSAGPLPPAETPLVVQVSRWDRLKDPTGVMIGFAEHVVDSEAHLVLAGPGGNSVSDDPEGAEVLEETQSAWRELSGRQRSRVHLASLPMVEIEENAAIVNALQRHATVIVQKSIAEGFGLTVAEAMWKFRPVVASAVGGILEQVEDRVTGLLLQDPTDLPTFGETVSSVLQAPSLGSEIGKRAHEHVKKNFLQDRHSLQYVRLFEELLG